MLMLERNHSRIWSLSSFATSMDFINEISSVEIFQLIYYK